MYQVFVTLLSCLFLKEACGLFEIFNLALVIGGITLVVQPPFMFGTGEVNIKSKPIHPICLIYPMRPIHKIVRSHSLEFLG